MKAKIQRILRWPAILVVGYLCFLVVYGLVHSIILAGICGGFHWDYDSVATRCNGVALWPWRLVASWQWPGHLLGIIGGVYILGMLAFVAVVLPVRMFLWLFGLVLRVLRVNV